MNQISKILNKLTDEFEDLLCEDVIRNEISLVMQYNCIASDIVGEDYENSLNSFDEKLLEQSLKICLSRLSTLFKQQKIKMNKNICILIRNDMSHNALATSYSYSGKKYDVLIFNLGTLEKINEITSLYTENRGKNINFSIGMFCFIFFHEIGHRYNGHQGIDRSTMKDSELTMFKRMIEWDADSFSATQLSSIFFEMSIKKGTVKTFNENLTILIYIFILSFMMNESKEAFITHESVKSMNYLPSQFRTIECVGVMDEVMINMIRNGRNLFPTELYSEFLMGSITEEGFLLNYVKNIPEMTDAFFGEITRNIKKDVRFKDKFLKINDLKEFEIFKVKESYSILEEVRITYSKYYLCLKKYAKLDLANPIK
ncbi:hypothetical protein [Vagococcus salmoninarum]|uniref:hypothetical protein n=1 Tax=Vagococcus salmoninarum TaxID=2739 RepID=UPI00187FE595|nr:hypothetical protein [Vagococcus salmoninarum]MBE9387600.1 hypothetical protein [Vagococcus salmoninarum]